ncbi:MAG: biotin transporter BioY [Lachnospiraceae bacterium]|nr:biotin transporter BioY [Lachnospiraceae bacterium]
MKKLSVKELTLTALMAALFCVISPFSIPVGPVPVSFSVLILFLSLYMVGRNLSLLACAVYILLGLCGLPVFSGFTGGPGKLLGPTGGYIAGYLFMLLIAGTFIDRYYGKLPLELAGMLLGLITLYAFGTLWLSLMAKLTFTGALAVAVLPFIIPDCLKIALSCALGHAIKKRLSRSSRRELLG